LESIRLPQSGDAAQDTKLDDALDGLEALEEEVNVPALRS
jgi:hypothetical protein